MSHYLQCYRKALWGFGSSARYHQCHSYYLWNDVWRSLTSLYSDLINLSQVWGQTVKQNSKVDVQCIKHGMYRGIHFMDFFSSIRAASMKGIFYFSFPLSRYHSDNAFVRNVQGRSGNTWPLSPLLQWRVELQHCCQSQMPALIKPEARWQLSTLEPAF